MTLGLPMWRSEASRKKHSGVEEHLAGETLRIVTGTWLPLRGQYTLAGPAALYRRTGACFPFNCRRGHAGGHQKRAIVGVQRGSHKPHAPDDVNQHKRGKCNCFQEKAG